MPVAAAATASAASAVAPQPQVAAPGRWRGAGSGSSAALAARCTAARCSCRSVRALRRCAACRRCRDSSAGSLSLLWCRPRMPCRARGAGVSSKFKRGPRPGFKRPERLQTAMMITASCQGLAGAASSGGLEGGGGGVSVCAPLAHAAMPKLLRPTHAKHSPGCCCPLAAANPAVGYYIRNTDTLL